MSKKIIITTQIQPLDLRGQGQPRQKPNTTTLNPQQPTKPAEKTK